MTLGSCTVNKEDSVGAGPQKMCVNLLCHMEQQIHKHILEPGPYIVLLQST